MSSPHLPRLPLPEPLRGTEIPSFTNYSIVVRLPDIARRVLAENELLPENLARMQALIAEIPTGKIRPLDNPLAPDAADWQRYIELYLDWDWLHVPWFFAEAYFYERVLEATGYYRPGPGQGMDPFALQKRLGLDSSRAATRTLNARLNAAIKSSPSRQAVSPRRPAVYRSFITAPAVRRRCCSGALTRARGPNGDTGTVPCSAPVGWQADDFLHLLSVDLWGNQVDLSLWPVAHGKAAGEEAFHTVPVSYREGRQERVLVDDSQALAALLSSQVPRRVDFLLDNAGFELICDLALIDYLLHACQVQQVTLHVKAQPTFVSDAMIKDVLWTVERLERETDPEALPMAGRLREALSAGRMVVRDDFYWTSPLPGWEMPAELQQELGQSGLIVSKGDANYRRLLGDRHWPATTSSGEILNYLPAPALLLRTLKSEIVVGLAPGQVESAAKVDKNWMIDGQWGLIQLVV